MWGALVGVAAGLDICEMNYYPFLFALCGNFPFYGAAICRFAKP